MPGKKVRSKAIFDGPLSEPIVRIDPWQAAFFVSGRPKIEQERVWSEVQRYELGQQIEKLLLLARRYKIDLTSESAGLLLAFKIAEECVPGFEMVDKPARGRRTGSNKYGSTELSIAVHELIYNPANEINTVIGACIHLSRHSRNKKWRGVKAKNLAKAYHDYQKKFIRSGWQSKPFFAKMERVLAPAVGPPFGIKPGSSIPEKK